MEYIELGKTGIRISRIAHGCMELGGYINDSIQWKRYDFDYHRRVLNAAIDAGINFFDTAEVYGHGESEEIVGRALKDRRKECVVATKVSPEHLRPKDLRASAIASLKRLQTDTIDLYYLHWPNSAVPLADTLGEMTKLLDEGLIRSIGVSNFSPDLLAEALSHAPVSAVQMEYNLLSRSIEERLLPFCREHSISVMTYNSIAKGVLSGDYHLRGARLEQNDFRAAKTQFKPEIMKLETDLIGALHNLANVKHTTVAQVSIAWLLASPGISSAIVGTQNLNHMLENALAADVKLSQQEYQSLSNSSAQLIGLIREAEARP